MWTRKIDLITIGDMAVDAFIRIKEASVNCDIDKKNCKLSVSFGDKIPYESVETVYAVGNAANAAVSASRLGLSSALVSDLGDDENGKRSAQTMNDNNISMRYVTVHKKMETNFHYALWYEDERTILVKHEKYPRSLPKLITPSWIYLSSIGSDTEKYHNEIIDYLKANPEVKLTFQPGTFQIKLGDALSYLYQRADVFCVNVEEAQRILGVPNSEPKVLLQGLKERGPKVVLVTDGPRGAYMHDGESMWYMPIYPDPKPPLERTGCGDAFASTFSSALILGKTPVEALLWAPINPMSVVQYVGAQKGLLTREQLEEHLSKAPTDYQPRKLNS